MRRAAFSEEQSYVKEAQTPEKVLSSPGKREDMMCKQAVDHTIVSSSVPPPSIVSMFLDS